MHSSRHTPLGLYCIIIIESTVRKGFLLTNAAVVVMRSLYNVAAIITILHPYSTQQESGFRYTAIYIAIVFTGRLED